MLVWVYKNNGGNGSNSGLTSKHNQFILIDVADGMKAREAMEWMGLAEQELGNPWTTPARFRIGASSLLDDVRSELHASARRL